uniref:Uncharacterized protein n=1 Tax=Romanomermis culicivorax TaxID=13658 RepID=A0A915JK05_ROMCU
MHHLALGSRDSRRSVNLIEDVFEPLRREILSKMETKQLEKNRDEFESVALQSEKSGDSWEEDKVTEEMISSDVCLRERYCDSI